MNNSEIAGIFYEVSIYLDMQDIPFEPRAYEKVAKVLENLEVSVSDIYKEEGLKGLEDISGVGKSIAGHIEELLKTGKFKKYESLKKKIPVDIAALTRIEGMGPKKVKVLYKELGIKTLKDLEKAARAGNIQKLPGFGKKSETNILQGIEFVKKNSGRMLLSEALPVAKEIIESLKKLKEVKEISEAGSLRRRKETIGDIDILVSSKEPEKVIDYFVKQKNVVKVWGKGPTKASVRMKFSAKGGPASGWDIDLRVLAPESFGSGLQYFTGSKAHNIKTRNLAIKKKLKLNEYGVFSGKKRIAGKTEKDVYEAIGLSYIEPEMREDTGEVEILDNGKKLPTVLSYDSLCGDLQVHTNWTDGANTIREMAEEAKRRGLSYIVITDHTKGLAMTGGLDEKKILLQMGEIKELNKRIKGITILTGSEVNILPDGSLDVKDEVLQKLDVVGVSIHSNFRMSKKEMTERILRAIQNPNVDILFHPTGRLIQKRDAYDVDMERIIKEAKKTGTILEINAFPMRLDLKDEYIRMATESGAGLCISSDAHHKKHFQYLEYGIAQARRGWASTADIINTYSAAKMLSMLKKNHAT